jgi:hypothetical protein
MKTSSSILESSFALDMLILIAWIRLNLKNTAIAREIKDFRMLGKHERQIVSMTIAWDTTCYIISGIFVLLNET